MSNVQLICYLSCFILTVAKSKFYTEYDNNEYDPYQNEYPSYENDPDQMPTFRVGPKTFSVEIGAQVKFPCDAESPDDAYVLMFRYISHSKRDRMLYVGDTSLGKTKRIRKEGQTFTLSNIRKSDAGTYVCRFETQAPVEIRHTLNVQYPAKIERISEELQKVAQGSTVSLQCRAQGNPPPAITWSRKDGRLPSGQKSVEGLSITLEQVDRHVAGTYICTASNGIGEPSSTNLEVKVEYKPEVITEQSIMKTARGYEAVLVCLVHARPSAEVIWLRDDSLVSSNKHLMNYDGALRHTLTITNVSEADFGEYSCRARNLYGEKSSILTLTGLPKTPEITSNPSGGEKNSYTLTWTTETFAPIIQYRVRFRRMKNSGTNRARGNLIEGLYSPHRNVGKETRFSHGGVVQMRHVLPNLETAEYYETEIRMENKFGWSPFSKKFQFYTKKEVADGRSSKSSGFPKNFSAILSIGAILFNYILS